MTHDLAHSFKLRAKRMKVKRRIIPGNFRRRMRLRTNTPGILISTMRKRVTNLAGKRPDDNRDDNDDERESSSIPGVCSTPDTKREVASFRVFALSTEKSSSFFLFYWCFEVCRTRVQSVNVFLLAGNARDDDRKLLKIHFQFIYREIKHVGSDIPYFVRITHVTV